MKAAALNFNTKLNSPDLELDPNMWTRKMGLIKYQDLTYNDSLLHNNLPQIWYGFTIW